MTESADERLERLERRVRELEDRLALYQLIATYGPAVDSGTSEVVGSLWTEAGFYDTFPVVLEGRDEIAAMVLGDRHQSYMANGCAHVQGMPHIAIHGDTAVATLYSQLFLRDDENDGFRLWRVAANRWELVREAGGWRVVGRVNKLLDGSPDGRELLRRGIEDEPV